MSTAPALRTRIRSRPQSILSVLLVCCLSAAMGCTEEDEEAGVDMRVRDVEFGRVIFKPVDTSGFYCPFEVAVFNLEITNPTMSVLDSYESPLGAGQSSAFSFLSDWGRLHAAPGDEVCVSVTTFRWPASPLNRCQMPRPASQAASSCRT